MERPWSYKAPEGISSEIGGGNKKLFGGERKFCGGVKDNMQLRSITLKHYRLLAFPLAVPPPWGCHLSQSAEQKESNENRNCAKQKACKERKRDKGTPKDSPIIHTSRVIFQGSNTRKSSSEESEPVSSASFVGESGFVSKRM